MRVEIFGQIGYNPPIMDQRPNRTFCWAAICRLFCVACLLGITCCPVHASTEAAFAKACTQHKALKVLNREAYDLATRNQPDRCLELAGQVKGVFKCNNASAVILVLPDEYTVDIQVPATSDIQPNSRVRCLVKQSGGYGRTRLTLIDHTWDQTPLEVLAQQAKAALGIADAQKEQAAKTAEAYQRRGGVKLPSRGGDSLMDYERWIAYFNPKLSAGDVHTIASSIASYCAQYGLDNDWKNPYIVIAVIAAESRFNPNARSYKGAMGLGQLMPSTAAAHGVDPYDPVQNLEAAIRIISTNLAKYQDWNLAMAAYNAGNGAVKKYGGVPPYRETRNYLWRIYEYYCLMTGQTPEKRH